MPQVFGDNDLPLISMASLWVEADYLDDVNAHEEALHSAGFDDQNLPVHLQREGFDPRGQVFGQHLNSDRTHHRWAIVRVDNPAVDPNARETSVGGQRPRYVAEIHAVPVKATGRAKPEVTPIWHGNDVRKFINGPGNLTWPHVQKLKQDGPRRQNGQG